MKTKTTKIYPVQNGDTSLITLADKTTILIDSNIRELSKDENNHHFDVKADLLKSINKDNNKPFINLFIQTHPDQDHCRGFEKNFHIGSPKDYKDENLENDEIIINEIWVTSIIFSYNLSKDGKALRREVLRRKELYDNDDIEKELPGNRLRIIGYDGEEKLDRIPHYYPGNTINEIDGNNVEDFSIFIHGPFKKSLIEGRSNKDRNVTSIIIQARFHQKGMDSSFSFRAIFGGDSDHYIWEKVLEITKAKKREESLMWDLFLAPHHCSWTYFNDVPYTKSDENKIPKESSLEVLDYKISSNSVIIASSKKIEDDEDNPPHYAAKDEYLKKVSKENFLNTAVEPSEKKPQPIIFEIGENEFSRNDVSNKAKQLSRIAKQFLNKELVTTSEGKLSTELNNGVSHKDHKFYGE